MKRQVLGTNYRCQPTGPLSAVSRFWIFLFRQTAVKMMSTIDETEELNQEGDNLFYESRFLVQPVSLLGQGAGEGKQAIIKN
jgi:hypothetical protein